MEKERIKEERVYKLKFSSKEMINIKLKIKKSFPNSYKKISSIFYIRGRLYRKNINKKFQKNRLLRQKFPENLNLWERKIYSQNGEDGISLELIKRIGTTNKFYVEFGTQDGSECNTRVLREKFGWGGLLMDGGYENNKINLKKEYITAENIEKLFKKYNVPKEFDLLSIDIDSNDYYVWDAIKNYFPRIVIIEYNSKIPLNKSKSIKYNPKQVWGGTDYFGASLLAFKKLGEKKSYRLLCCDNLGINAFFVRNDLINFKIRDYKDIYRKPKYGTIFRRGHRKSEKKMIPI